MLRSGGTQVEIKTVSGINEKGKGWVGRKEKACSEKSEGVTQQMWVSRNSDLQRRRNHEHDRGELLNIYLERKATTECNRQ